MVCQLVNLVITFSQQVQTLDFDKPIRLGFGNTDSLVFYFDDVMIVREFSFGNPFLFIWIRVSRTSSPQTDLLVLDGVKIAEHDNSRIRVTLTNEP